MITGEWIEHAGTECPVPPETRVTVELRDGSQATASAGVWCWDGDGKGRIARYRVVPQSGVLERPDVGDLASGARGSGARFNAGKPPLDLIPAGVMADVTGRPATSASAGINWGYVLLRLEDVQMGLTDDPRVSILGALNEIYRPSLWADCANVFDYGRRKYAAWNWAKGMPWSVPLGSALRHIVFGVLQGEADDAESDLPHVGHIACNLVMLWWYCAHYPEGNDLRRATEPRA